MNLAKIIIDHDPARIALVDADRSVTYGELRDRIGAARARLVAEGLGPDDRVLIACGNELAFAVGAMAVLGIGGIAVPVNPRSPLPEFLGWFGLIEPKAVLVSAMTAWFPAEAGAVDAPLIDLGTIDSEVSDPPPIVDRSDDDLAFFMLTSGVTDRPKAAMLSHGNLAWVQELSCDGTADALTADDITLGVLPFTHIFGLNVVLLSSLRIGATCVLQPRFDAGESLEVIRRHGVTRVAGAPPMWKRWAEADAPDDSLETVTYAASGAAALPPEVFAAIRDRYGIEIGEGYGLTETSPIVTHSRGADPRPSSVGKIAEGVELALVDDDGTPVEHGDTGQIVVRSPGVFKGYLDSPDATAGVLTPEGWFWTGDVGVMDDDGYLYLVDRVKDLIIVSGFNVYPAEVESVLMQHPDVRGAVVVGTPHGETGEAVVAHVSGQVSEHELDAFARSRMSGYKCPTEYHFVDELDELPVAPTGKPVRKDLR